LPHRTFKKKQIQKEISPHTFFVTVFASASFSTFASRAFLFVGKFTNKSCTPFGKLAKELNPAHQQKTAPKNFSPKNCYITKYL
jgi:hypothetical protein